MDGLVVGLLLAVLAVLVAILVVVLLARRKARQLAERSAPGPTRDPFGSADTDAVRGDPRTVQVGDIVEIRGQTYGVRGTLRFQEGSWSWAEHLLDDAAGRDGTGKRWFSVEEDPDLILVLWTEVREATVRPGAETLDFDGRRYTSDESGSARYQATGTTGLDPAGSVRYHDYRAGDGARLSFEEYGGSGRWEVARGEELTRAEIMIYPAAR